MKLQRVLGRIPAGLVIILMTVAATVVAVTSRSTLRAESGGEMGSGPGTGGGEMGGSEMGGGEMGGMGPGSMGGEGAMGGGASGGAEAPAAPTAPAEPQIEAGMVSFPDVPGINGLVDTGTFYRFTYTQSSPGGDDTFRVELPKQLEGEPVTELQHFEQMWGQIFRIFEAGSAQRAGELPEERASRLAGIRAGSAMMKARSDAEEVIRAAADTEGPLPEEQVAIQRGLEAGSQLAAKRIRAQ